MRSYLLNLDFLELWEILDKKMDSQIFTTSFIPVC
jgi:hypothetical protein